MMLQKDKPCDCVIGTGEPHSVKEFLEEVFNYAGLDWKEYAEIDSRYFRPTEVELLLADASKAGRESDISGKHLYLLDEKLALIKNIITNSELH